VVGHLHIECNELGGVATDIEVFARQDLHRGDACLHVDTGVVGGALEALRAEAAELIPTVHADSCAAGPLTSDCYRQIKRDITEPLRAALPVDGVLLLLHGAATAEDVGDLEGDLLRSVREIVGQEVPIVATLDLHAHVTGEMVRYADALLAWETYPHVDQRETGGRAARMLLDILAGKCRPTMAMAKAPVITGALNGSTEGDSPFAQSMRIAKALEGRDGVLSTSVFLVHPSLDQPGMGSGALVITDDDLDKAQALAVELTEGYWSRRFDLEPTLHTPEAAIEEGLRVDGGPVLLVECADCCGGGAAGDSVAALRALLDADVDVRALTPVVDPGAAAMCHKAGGGNQVTLALGHNVDRQWGEPINVTGTVERLSDGQFVYTGARAGVDGNMGPSSVLRIGGIQVLITTYATYDWADEQYRAVGLNPLDVKFIVVKNPMNYRLAYGDNPKAAYILDTPGPTPATFRHVRYKKLQRPYFPADEGWEFSPTILS
jgi:microcystin degradation protein MlrC